MLTCALACSQPMGYWVDCLAVHGQVALLHCSRRVLPRREGRRGLVVAGARWHVHLAQTMHAYCLLNGGGGSTALEVAPQHVLTGSIGSQLCTRCVC
jgi:hypothetical protein